MKNKDNVKEKNKMHNRRKINYKEKGITLVALVITIIILLILAGVTLSTALSDNGLFKRAKEAGEKYKESERQEDEALKSIEDEIDGIWKDNDNNDDKDRETEANAPKLSDGMIPIKYVSKEGKWEICSENDPEWYSYTEDKKEWANVMLSDCGNKEDGNKYTINDVGKEVPEADLGSMFVWIPRYAYNIKSGYHTNTSSPELEIQWLLGTTNNYVDKEGKVNIVKKHTDANVEDTKPEGQFIVHPAFTDGNENSFADGEWKAEVEGIWVSKFEAGIGTNISGDKVSSNTVENSDKIEYPKVDVEYDSQGNKTSTNYYLPMFKGRQFGYNYVTESQCYNLGLALDDNSNPYGLSMSANSHLMKSSEWGAVAYLAISKYGANEPNTDKICQNDVTIIAADNVSVSPVKNPNSPSNNTWGMTAVTGYSAIDKSTPGGDQHVISYTSGALSDNYSDSYAWNVVDNGSNAGNGTKASTTGNITGIYDMEGGLANYTASWVDYNDEQCSCLKTCGDAFTKNANSTYLATAYPVDPDSIRYDFDSSYSKFDKVHGDAIYETSGSCGINNSWFQETIEADSSVNEPFFPRGGVWGDPTIPGLCGLTDYSGGAVSNHGFFSVLVVE